MKKFTGTILLTAALLTHFAINIATEESYIFSSSESVETSSMSITRIDNVSGVLTSPAAGGSLIKSSGLYATDDQLNP